MRRDGTRCRLIQLALMVAGLVGFNSLVTAESDAAANTKPIALVGAMIRTQTDAGDFVGTIVIQDQKIVAMGPNVTPPSNARQINLVNHVITPGWIDARSTLWMNVTTAREGGRDASLNIVDGIDPFADDWRDAARQGVTAVYVQPHNSGSLGGGGAVLGVGPTTTAEDLVIRHPAGVQAALGVAGATQTPTANPLAEILARLGLPAPPAQPATAAPPASNALTRFAAFESLRGQFEAAKKYGESKPDKKDAGKELLLRAMKKDLPVRLEVGHEDDVRNSLKLTDYGVRLVYERLDRVKSLPEELTEKSNTIVVGPFIGNKKSDDVRKLALDGRKFVVGTFGDSPRDTSWLRMQVATAINEGYPRERMLQAVTRDAAELIGVGDKLGSLEVGRVADLAVFAGDPLDPSVPVRMTIGQGVVTYDNPKAAYETDRFPKQESQRAGIEMPYATERGFIANHVVTSDDLTADADAGHLRGADGIIEEKKLTDFSDHGFAQIVVSPGSRNVLAGTVSVKNTNGKESPTECGFKFVLTAAARNNDRYPDSLIGQVELIRARLSGGRSESNIYLPNSIRSALLSRRDEPIKMVKERKLPAYFEANTRTEIQAALTIIHDFNLRGVLLHPNQLDETLAEAIRQANVAVVIGPISHSTNDKTIAGLSQLATSGVPIMLGGGEPAELRRTAAILANAGVPRKLAKQFLRGPTTEHFGMAPAPKEYVETFIWDAEPLNLGARMVNRSLASDKTCRPTTGDSGSGAKSTSGDQ